jgi:MFS superfamily sulfate permease-like transporter
MSIKSMSPNIEIRRNLKDDLMAAFSMALVTIPLALGIAIASDAPILSGVWSAIIGGLVATALRSSHLAVNGPATGLIVVVLAGVNHFGGGLLGFGVVLAATIVAGGLLVLAGLLRLGRLADTFPTAVVQGLLAAIGLMILGRQMHVALGAQQIGVTSYEILLDVPNSFFRLNPIIAIIGLGSLAILIFHNMVTNRWLQMIPATIWVIIFAVGAMFAFNLGEAHDYTTFGQTFNISPDVHLVSLPDKLLDTICFPVFDQVGRVEFWILSATIAVFVFIETLMSGKIVDNIDPLKRHTNLNRELVAVGISNMVAGGLGALPIITAIPLYNGAKTKMSNFYHGLILLILAAIFSLFAITLPLAALAALLVYTGYKFAAPKLLKDTYRKGDDQLLVFLATLLTSVNYGLLTGIGMGLVVALLIHQTKSNISPKQFLSFLFRPVITTKRRSSGELSIRSQGVLNFVNILSLKKILREAAAEKHIIMDLSHTRLVDFTVLQYLSEEAEILDIPNVQFDIIGLDTHASSSRHPYSMRVLPEDQKPQLSKRQVALKELTEQYEGEFFPEIRWDVNQLREFIFFRTRKIDYKLNVAKGLYGMFFDWESCDIAFDEGVLFANQERHTSVVLLHLPFNAPVFVLEREMLIDRIAMKNDINFIEFNHFSEKFLLQGTDRNAIEDFFTPELIQFFEKNDTYHIESNGTMLLVFKQMSFANAGDMQNMHTFSEKLAKVLVGNLKKQAQSLKF